MSTLKKQSRFEVKELLAPLESMNDLSDK